MNAERIADRLALDECAEVAAWVDWARRRRRGEELRLLDPLVAAGLVERRGDDLRLTAAGRRVVRDLLEHEPAEAVAA